jgi:hypothetical protein
MLKSNAPIQQTIKLHILSHRQGLEMFRFVNKKSLGQYICNKIFLCGNTPI